MVQTSEEIAELLKKELKLGKETFHFKLQRKHEVKLVMFLEIERPKYKVTCKTQWSKRHDNEEIIEFEFERSNEYRFRFLVY